MMNRTLGIGIVAAAALTFGSMALAHGGGGGITGSGGSHGSGAAVRSGGGGSFGAQIGSITQSRGSAPVTVRGNLGKGAPSAALGGRPFANTNRSFDGGRVRVPDSVCRSWDRGHEHLWNNHRCRFVDGGWVAYDGGYPLWYGDSGYESPANSAADDYQDVADAPAPAEPSEPAVSRTPFATIQDVQDALANGGYYHGETDGNISPQMRHAVAAFQRDHHLSATGSLDLATLSALAMQ